MDLDELTRILTLMIEVYGEGGGGGGGGGGSRWIIYHIISAVRSNRTTYIMQETATCSKRPFCVVRLQVYSVNDEHLNHTGAGRSSEVERSLMVR